MNIFKLAAQILLFYILYRVIVNFVIPTYRSIKRFRNQVQQVQERMNQQQQNQQSQAQQPQSAPQQEVKPKPEGEYIEFEEVKD